MIYFGGKLFHTNETTDELRYNPCRQNPARVTCAVELTSWGACPAGYEAAARITETKVFLGAFTGVSHWGPAQTRQRGSDDFALCGSCLNSAKKVRQKMNENKLESEHSSVEPHHEQDAAKVEVGGDDLDGLFDDLLDVPESSLFEQPEQGFNIMPPTSPTRPRPSCESPLPKSSASKAAEKRAFAEMALTNEELMKSNERLRNQINAGEAVRAESSRTARETDDKLFDMLLQCATMSPSSE
eukprot:jgi/Chrpa1/17912/Chrysochromulina_OHIO_Genome00026250-RA